MARLGHRGPGHSPAPQPSPLLQWGQPGPGKLRTHVSLTLASPGEAPGEPSSRGRSSLFYTVQMRLYDSVVRNTRL